MARAAAALFLAAGLGAALGGCTGPHPFVREGDAKSVAIGYSGDVASAWPLARKHCAAYARVPRLVDPGVTTALFDCVNPRPAP